MNTDRNIMVPASIINDLTCRVQDKIYEALDNEKNGIYIMAEYPCKGSIMIDMDSNGRCDVNGYSGNDRELTLLADKIKEALPLWESVKDEWTDDRSVDDDVDPYWAEHGFSSEYDFWMYKEG